MNRAVKQRSQESHPRFHESVMNCFVRTFLTFARTRTLRFRI